MLSNTSQVLRLASNVARIGVQRNLATSYVAANKAATDPVQGLFVEKIREYATKKKAAGGKFVDATKETEADLAAELEKVAKNYGGGKGVDMSKFPDFKWAEPAVETPDLK
jgi:F-type H+-transporting ATPase subunit 6